MYMKVWIKQNKEVKKNICFDYFIKHSLIDSFYVADLSFGICERVVTDHRDFRSVLFILSQLCLKLKLIYLVQYALV